MHRRSLIPTGTLVLAGCLGRSELRFDYHPVWTAQHAGRAVVLFAIQDARPPVVRHEEPPDWVGFVRSGFGMPIPVGTAGAKPFAAQVQEDLILELKSLGFRVHLSPVSAATEPTILGRELADPGSRGLAVLIDAWQTDTYRRMDLVYRFAVRVVDANGSLLVREVVQREDTLPWRWAQNREQIEDEVRDVYADAIRRMIRQNDRVMAGLTGGAVATPPG
jgi:hypothetical protein